MNELEREFLKASNSYRTRRILELVPGLIAIIVVIVLLVVIPYERYRQKQRYNIDIKKPEEVIENQKFAKYLLDRYGNERPFLDLDIRDERWDILDYLVSFTITAHESPKDAVTAVAFSPDGKTLASTSYDVSAQKKKWRVRLWTDGWKLQAEQKWWVGLWKDDWKLQAEQWYEKIVTDIAFTPDGKKLAIASEDGTAKLWEGWDEATVKRWGNGEEPNWRWVETFGDETTAVTSIAFAPPDGRMLMIVNKNGTAKLWSVDRKKLLATPINYEHGVTAIAFTSDGKMLASGNKDGTVKLWLVERENLYPLKPIVKHEGAVLAVAFDLSGRVLASAGYDQTVKLWSVKDERELKLPEKHKLGVTSVAFAPDGKTLASASFDCTVKLWTASGQLLHTFEGHVKGVTKVAFAPKEQVLVSASEDGTVKVWSVQKKQVLTTLKAKPDVGIPRYFALY